MPSNRGAGEDSWMSLELQGYQRSQSWRKSTLNVRWQDWYWSWSFSTLAPDVKSQVTGKDPDAGKDWGQEEKGTTEDEKVGQHHRLNGHEFGQTLGDGEGQGSTVCCSPWGYKELDVTERLNSRQLEMSAHYPGVSARSCDTSASWPRKRGWFLSPESCWVRACCYHLVIYLRTTAFPHDSRLAFPAPWKARFYLHPLICSCHSSLHSITVSPSNLSIPW